jgi:hypothetical protein
MAAPEKVRQSLYLPFMVLSAATVWDSRNLDFSSRTRSTRVVVISTSFMLFVFPLSFIFIKSAKGKVANLSCYTELVWPSGPSGHVEDTGGH